MKELEGQTHVKTLTSQAAKMYSNRDTFMAEAKGEMNMRARPAETVREPQVFQSPLTHSHDSIRNPQLKQYVLKFEEKMQQKPITAWSVEDLKDTYFQTNRFISQLGSSMEFGDREAIVGEAHPLNNLVIGELERRGVSLKEFFLENPQLRKESPPWGGPGSPGRTDNGESKGGPVLSDKVAAEIFARYMMEGGQADSDKGLQAGRDLSMRAQELIKEREAIEAEKGAQTPEGELTTATETKVREINNRLREIHEIQSSIFEISSKVEKPKGEDEILVNEAEVLIKRITDRGLQRNDINDLSKLAALDEEDLRTTRKEEGEEVKEDLRTTRKDLVEKLSKFIDKQYPIDTSHFPSHILLAARNFTELREQLISAIIFKSFEDRSETNDYDVGLYAASNLDILLGFLSKDDNDRYKQLFSLRTATRFFQTMNSTVIKGTFDRFGNEAENINFEHFENMRDITGSGLAMRLFEQGYKDVLASDTRVGQERINGIKDFVENRFKEMNETGLIQSEYSRYRGNTKLEDWEIQRALAAGRTFFNITLRAAENIATGQINTDEKRLVSPPQEDMVRILNWNQWFLARFSLGLGRYGKDYQEMSLKNFDDFLKYKGSKLDKNAIVEFGGVDVKKMEQAGQYRTSGVYSGWRIDNIAFREVYFLDEKGKLTSVDEFRKRQGVKDEIANIKKRIEREKEAHPHEDPSKCITPEDQEAYAKVFEPLVSGLDYSLSMLLKNGSFGLPDDPALGYLLRQRIWERIAQTNTPLMLDYLRDIKYEWSDIQKWKDEIEKLNNDKSKSSTDDQKIIELQEKIKKANDKRNKTEREKSPVATSLKEILIAQGWVGKTIILDERGGKVEKVWGDPKGNDKDWKDYFNNDLNWASFKRKTSIGFERKIREGINLRPDDKKIELPELEEKNKLTDKENDLQKMIIEEGKKLAPHLADIAFPYTPFMNDMPFEKFQYKYAGQTFYKRRTTGDLGGYDKGQKAFGKLMTNPGGLSAKEALEAMGEIVEGVGSPEGPGAGIDANFPAFSALLDITITSPGIRQGIVKMLLEATRTETSIAQKWAGIKAESFTEADAATLIDDAVKAGILSRELAKYLRKKKKLAFGGLLWALFRDVFPLIVAANLKDFVDASLVDLKAK